MADGQGLSKVLGCISSATAAALASASKEAIHGVPQPYHTFMLPHEIIMHLLVPASKPVIGNLS